MFSVCLFTGGGYLLVPNPVSVLVPHLVGGVGGVPKNFFYNIFPNSFSGGGGVGSPDVTLPGFLAPLKKNQIFLFFKMLEGFFQKNFLHF